MNLQDPALTFAIALAAGIVAQAIARHLRVPGILVLLVSGVLLGPEFANVVRPDALGDGLQPIVGLAVAVILFEGGLQLNIGRLRREAVVIRRLITIGALVTLTGGTVIAQLLLGWDWRVALLFGTLVVVTGPTVINPLTRRIGLRQNLRTILEAEGVLIDPIGAILAVVALEVVLATGPSAAATGLLGLPGRLGLGALVGVGGGLLIGFTLRTRRIIPSGYENIFTLAIVLGIFQASNAILPETGIMTVAVAGLVVGNMQPRRERELAEFKEQLTILLVGFLFVLLSAAVRMEDVLALGPPGFITVLLLMLLVRPAGVALSTWDTDYSRRERAFLAWLAPRGIVAFAISSLFAVELAHYEMPAEGVQLRAMVFLVIAMTVIIQGGTAGIVASLLNVRMRANHGFLIVGANAVARLVATALREASPQEEPIVLVDTNPNEAKTAEDAGFRVVYGNAGEERTLLKGAAGSRRAIVAATPNEAVNLLIAKKVEELHRDIRRLVLIDPTEPGIAVEQVHESESHVLFGRGIDFEWWTHEVRQDRVDIEPWRYDGPSGARIGEVSVLQDAREPALPLARRRGPRVDPVDDDTVLREGDVVWYAILRVASEEVAEALTGAGWVPGMEDGVAPPSEGG